MPRYANPFYSGGAGANPIGAIAQSLTRALFGDPAAAMQQQLQQSQIDENEAQIRNANSMADARNLPIKARGNYGSTIASLYQHPSSPLPAVGAGGDTITVPPGFEGVAGAIANALPAETGGPAPALMPAGATRPIAAPSGAPETFDQGGLANLIEQMAQGGDIAQVGEVLQALGAFGGGDELARRGMVAAGHTPTDDFALTPERADAIRAQGYGADMDIEQVRSGDRRYGVDTSATTQRRGQDIGSRDRRRGQDIGSRDRTYGVDVGSADRRYAVDRRGTRAVADGRSAALSVYPQLQITQVERDPNSRLGRANPDSFHNSTSGAIDARPIRGMTFDQYVQGYRDRGYEIIESRDEVTNPSGHATGPHWHVVLGEPPRPRATGGGRVTGTGPGGRPTSPGAVVSRAALKSLTEELDRQPEYAGVSANARRIWREQATIAYQETRNPVTAVGLARQRILANNRPNRPAPRPAAPAARPAAPAPAARRNRVIRYDRNGNRVG